MPETLGVSNLLSEFNCTTKTSAANVRNSLLNHRDACLVMRLYPDAEVVEDSNTKDARSKSLCRFRPKATHKNTNASASKNNNGHSKNDKR